MLSGGRLISRVDSRLLAAIGLGIVLASCIPLVHITTDTTSATIAAVTFFQGVGMGLTFLCINAAAYATLPAELRTEGAVLVTLGRTLSGAIGISIAGTLLTHSIAANQSRLVEYLSVFDTERWANALQMVGDRATALLAMQIQQQATVIGYENVFAVISGLALSRCRCCCCSSFRSARRPPWIPPAPKPCTDLSRRSSCRVVFERIKLRVGLCEERRTIQTAQVAVKKRQAVSGDPARAAVWTAAVVLFPSEMRFVHSKCDAALRTRKYLGACSFS